MSKYRMIYLWGVLIGMTLEVHAQQTIQAVLQQVERHNPSLQAKEKWVDAQKWEARTGNYLSNPAVEFERMWGNRNNPEAEFALTVKQSLDFPTVYRQKNVLADLRARVYDWEWAAYRQEILLQAQQVCIELIYLQKQQRLLVEQLANAEQLAALYERKFAVGESNQLEINKIQLELLAARRRAWQNESALFAAREQLNSLNGGMPLDCANISYPPVDALPNVDTLTRAALAGDPALNGLAGERQAARQEVKVSRSQTLPKFDVGYKRNAKGDHVSSNGFVVGLSISLFENKHTVKRARAQVAFANATLEERRQQFASSLRQLHEQALLLQTTCKAYAALLQQQRNAELLNKALQAGQISLVDYFTELSTFYSSLEEQLLAERDYHLACASLFCHAL